MALFDDIKNSINSGAVAAGRGTRNIQLKTQLSSLDKQRERLMAQLGASLYEEVCNKDEFYIPRQDLFNSIAQLDTQRSFLITEINELAHQAQQAQAARTTAPCPHCGKSISISNSVCTACGTHINMSPPSPHYEYAPPDSTVYAPPDSTTPVYGADFPVSDNPAALSCSTCAAALEPDAKFCATCGVKVA